MLRDINSFIPVLIVDVESELTDPKMERLVHLPAIPSKGDTIALQADGVGDYDEAVVTDIAFYTRESSSTPLEAYIHVFVSYTKTRKDLEVGAE